MTANSILPVFAALRGYVLTDRNWVVGLFLLLLGLVPLGLNMVRVFLT